jgi:hypothetical protein
MSERMSAAWPPDTIVEFLVIVVMFVIIFAAVLEVLGRLVRPEYTLKEQRGGHLELTCVYKPLLTGIERPLFFVLAVAILWSGVWVSPFLFLLLVVILAVVVIVNSPEIIRNHRIHREWEKWRREHVLKRIEEDRGSDPSMHGGIGGLDD